MIGVGLIGAGFFGEMHARALAEVPGARLVAASRRSSAALDEFCARFAVRGYRDYVDLINAPDVDAVVIAAPHHLHAKMAVQAARAGKHILLEKPMALSLDECDRILSAVAEAGVKMMVGHLNHFARAYRIAKRLLDSGEMGEVVLGTSTMSKFWFAPNRRQWHLDRAMGGGMWLTAGMHCLDRLTWLVGPVSLRGWAFWDLGPQEFREKLADMTGGRVEWTASDEELVLGVVDSMYASKFSDGMRIEGALRLEP